MSAHYQDSSLLPPTATKKAIIQGEKGDKDANMD